ncbi:MAG: GspMb/PilO family protein [Candidatus Omnitrophota bacterium]
MKQVTRREVLFTVIATIFLLSYSVIQFGIRPFQKSCVDVREQIKLTGDTLIQSERVVGRAGAMEKGYDQLVKVFGHPADENKETSAMMSHLETAAGSSGIHIVNMQPLRNGGKNLLKTFSVEVVFDGAWDTITKFLYLAQSRPNLLRIDDLNIEKYLELKGTLRGRVVLTTIRIN